MNKRKSFNFGFTIIELLIVIVVIGILAAIGIVSYSKVQQSSRDAKRSSSISTIAEALENYYQKNGEYPSCTMMSGDSDYVSKTVLSGNIAKDVLSTPTTTSGTNSIQAACADLNTASSDLFSYIGDSSTNCTTGTSCSNYVLKYKEENTGNIITVKSRYGNEVSFAKAFTGASSSISGSHIKTLSNGEYLISTQSYDSTVSIEQLNLSKIGSDGILKWANSATGVGSMYNKNMSLTSDGGCVVVGYIYGTGAGGRDAYIIKYDSAGSIEWTRTWGSTDGEYFNSVIQSSDGGYLAVGGTYYYNTNYSDTLMVKFDKSGSFIWNRTWGGSSDDDLSSVVNDANGNYFVAGKACSYTASCKVLLQKINQSGDVAWTRISGGSSWDRAIDVIYTADNGIVVAGTTSSSGAGSDDVLLMRFSVNGELLWSRTWGNSNNDNAMSVLQSSNGDYYVSGRTYRVETNANDAIVIKYDKAGSVIWSRVFGSGNHDEVESASFAIDGGLVVSGYTQSFELVNIDNSRERKVGSTGSCSNDSCVLGAKTNDISYAGGGDPAVFVLKFKPNGLINGCSSPLCDVISGVSGDFSTVVSVPWNGDTKNPNGIIGTPVITEKKSVSMVSKDLLAH